MSENPPPNWGQCSPLYNHDTDEYEYGGLIWYGEEQVKKGQVAAAKDAFGGSPKFDRLSWCGTNDPEWTTWRDQNKGKEPYKQFIVL